MDLNVRCAGIAELATVVAAGISLVACAGGCSGTGSPSAAPGAVHGTIVAVGGPPNAPPQLVPGTVVVSRDGRTVAKQDVTAGTEFRFSLAPGRYQFTVTGTGAPCPRVNVDVTTSSAHNVTLTCQRK